MAGVETLEIEIQVNITADKFFEAFKKKEETSTDKTKAVSVHRDQPTSNFSVQTWNFFIDGKMEMVKEKIEVYEENKSLSSLALEGDVLKLYKSYKITLEILPKDKDDGVCIAKWTWAYEKLNDDVPPPTKYAAFVAQYTRDLETRLLSQS